MILAIILGIFHLIIDFIYWTKWAACAIALNTRKRNLRRRFDLYDFDAQNEPEKLGVLIPKEEKKWESPLSDQHLQKAADEIFIYGVNSGSEALIVRISRLPNDESEGWIHVKLADGRWYELEHTRGYQQNFGGRCTMYTCGGLQMYSLSAMRRWRISYTGMLREREHSDEMKKKRVFVKFTFIWTASSEVFDSFSDLDIRSTADSMAQAKWNSPFPSVKALAESLNFYAQSGVINGVLQIEDEPEKEIYLFGERIRNTGDTSFLTGSQVQLILGVVPENGLTLHLENASIPNMLHNYYFGFIVSPNSHISVVEDGVMITRMSEEDDRSKNICATFKAGRQYELHGIFVGPTKSLKCRQAVDGCLQLKEVKFEIDEKKGFGLMISGEISTIQKTDEDNCPMKSTFSTVSSRPLTVYFTDDASHFTELTGGKGSSLGKLTKFSKEIKAEFIVPQGIVVTTAAYNEILSSEVLEKIENLKNIAYGKVRGDIHEACKMVQNAVKCTELPQNLEKEIENKLRTLFECNINEIKFAVRSSATGEDTDQMSAAGQMDTFLGVQGVKEVFVALKKCWASQFGHIAVEYKRQNGQVLNSPMAVVIQEMVECESSGVLFTSDPVTNNPSVVVITGNYGLGESVVSGSEEPDTLVLKRSSKDELKIKSINVGLKQRRIVLKDSNTPEVDGTVTEDVPEVERSTCCLSKSMAIKLGDISLKIEKYFKSPRDIEWGIKEKNIFILQSRPITTGAALSDYEIKHEFDGPLRCEGEYFTLCNVGESMPGAVSTLGFDLEQKFFSTFFLKKEVKSRMRNNFQQSKYYSVSLLSFYNHLFLSVIDLLTNSEDLESLMSKAMMIAVFGRLIDDPEIKNIVKQRVYKSQKKGIKGLVEMALHLFYSGKGIEDLKKYVFNYDIAAERSQSSTEIFDLLMHSCSHLTNPIGLLMSCSGSSSTWNMFLFAVLAKAKGGIDNDVYSDFAKLLSSSTNVESADVPSAMEALSRSIAEEITSKNFKNMTVEDAQHWLETTPTSAGEKYREFLKRHGHRCLKELDVYSTNWNSDSKPLIKILQSMSGCTKESKEKREANFSDIFPHLNVRLNFISRLLLKIILPNCRRALREREASKSNIVKAVDNMRRGIRHLSKSMVAEGYIPDTDLLYFFTLDEINDLLETRNPRHISRAKHRRKLFPYLDNLQFPEMSKGIPVPINELKDEDFEFVADLTMNGIPVSQGIAKGFARVALTLKEAADIKPGEILITFSTDIGWSPYFPILGGVVTEIGGLISHGAVVSREYGLPCVVGIHGATKQFVTGDYVLLDGNKGILQRITPPNLETK